MEEKILSLIDLYYKEKKMKYEISKDYRKVYIKNIDIVTDVDLLRYILLNFKIENKTDYDYFSYSTKTCNFYMSTEYEHKDLNLMYSNLIKAYYEDSDKFYKYVEILNELSQKNLINVVENKFRKENSDEIKIFAKIVYYYANISNPQKNEVNFNYFIYLKKFEALNRKEKIFEFLDKFVVGNKIAILIKKCDEIFDIFDEIYDTKIFNNLSKDIVEFNNINNNKLLITKEEKKFIIQMVVNKDFISKMELLIKKIKNIFNNDIEIILYVDEYNSDVLFNLFKEYYISILIIKNTNNKNILMLSNKNKDIFIYYDYDETKSSELLIENEFVFINKYLSETNYFENLFLVFNKDYKIHKIKIGKNLSNFGFYIKDRVEQNYFNINEYKKERGNYSIYLYSEENTLCYEIFINKYPIFKKIFSLWLNYRKNNDAIIKDNIDSLIAIKGYDLLISCSKVVKNLYYNKIVFEESIEIDTDFNLKEKLLNNLDKKNCSFNTKNIYIVNSLENYLDKKITLPSNLIRKYNKRGFNDLLSSFYFIYKKFPVLNKKPIILQISYFVSYNLNIYKNKNEDEI